MVRSANTELQVQEEDEVGQAHGHLEAAEISGEFLK